jgi:uncharacterized repeat protein (TIGR01451 family)/CSLREA domain-containing protein
LLTVKLNRLINGLLCQRSRALLKWRGPLATLALFVLIASGFAIVRASAGERFVQLPWPASLSRIFGSRTATPLSPPVVGTVYTWVGGTPGLPTDWQIPTNWSPIRLVPASDDVLIFNGGLTPSPTVTNVPTQQIAALRLTNGVNQVSLSTSGTNTLTISGGTGTDLDMPGGTVMALFGSNALTISLTGPGHQATIAGQLIFQDGPHRLTGANAGEITMTGTNAFTATVGVTGNPFGTGTDGSVIFQDGATATFYDGGDPFGGAGHSVTTFNSGSTAHFGIASAFSSDGRTYGNLTLDGTQAYAGSGTNPTTVINDFSLEAGSTFTLSGAAGGDLNLLGNFEDQNTDAGTFDPNGRTVKFQGGNTTQTIFKSPSNPLSFFDVFISETAGGEVQLLSAVTIVGQLNLSTADSVLNLNQKTLSLNGTVIGAGNLKSDGAAKLHIGGTSGGSLGTLHFLSSFQSLFELTMARTGSGSSVTIGNDLLVDDFLNLTDGIVDMGTFTLTTNAPTVSRTKGWVIGNLKRFFTCGTSCTIPFDVGTANGYSPVSEVFTVPAAAATYNQTVKATAGAHPNISGVNKLQRYWTLNTPSPAVTSAAITFKYRGDPFPTGDVVGTEANYKVFKYDGSFLEVPNQSIDTGAHTASVTGVSSFSDWTLAEPSSVGPPDLTVTKSAPGSVPGGSTFTYKIKVSNSASATVTAIGVSVSDQLPAGVTFVSSTPACSESAGLVTCSGLPDIPAGGHDVVKIVVTAGTAPGTVQNTASASATNDPGSPHSSNTTSTFIITCITDLLVNSTGDGGDVNPGDGVCETGAANGVCTLRAAIEEANALNDVCGYLTVKFALPDDDPDGGHVYYKDDGDPDHVTNDAAHIGVTNLSVADDATITGIDPNYKHSWWRIQPASELPSIKVALDIDGYTQAGASPNTKSLNEGDDAILRIEIDGSLVGNDINGLTFTEAKGDYSIINGLVINHFNRAHDLYVDDCGGHIFSGNFLGVDVSGTVGDGTDGTGIFLKSGEDTFIGGDYPEDRNVIAGHGGEGGAGIWIYTSFTTVEGNYIGTDRNGAVAIPNTYGVIITGGEQNIIGCKDLDGDNVISGNTNIGVSIGNGAGNSVVGNFIGTDKTGQLPIPNRTGIAVSHGFLNLIGVNFFGEGFGNVISGNTEDGVALQDASFLTIVQTNLIGVAFDRVTPLGNGGNGVGIYGGSQGNMIGELFGSGGPGPGTRARFEARAQSLAKEAGRTFKESASQSAAKAQAGKASEANAQAGRARVRARKRSLRGKSPLVSLGEFFNQRLTKAKDAAAKRQAFVNKRSSASKGAGAADITPETCGCPSGANTIAYNGGDGVKVSSDCDLYNPISQNSIYSNFGLGINLVNNNPPEPPSTVTLNDHGDGDPGPNELQNFPVILDASDATGVVHFSLDTCYEGPYVIEFFANAAGCDPSGHGEGGTYLGFKEVPGSGTDYYSDALSLSPGDVITATATDYNGNTSEFSACFTLAPAVVGNVSVALNGPASVAESGATNLVYRFSRDYTGAPLTVKFSATGTASSSNDYTILSAPNIGFNGSNGTGTVAFGMGVDHVDLKVDPTADADFEASETVIITATSGAGYTVVDPSSATGTITDDNCPPGFLVTHADDTPDLMHGDGICADESQHCTLRAAVEEANALVNCGTIPITFDFSTKTTIALSLGELSVQHNVNIIGPPTDPLTTYSLIIKGNGSRAFHIDPGKIVSISNLTITDCVTSGDGGGVLNNGTLTLKGVTVNGNTAVNGGGIASVTNNSLTLINTTISGNKSSGNGGGLYNANGIATLTNVTIAYNTADSDGVGLESGGGIFVTSGDVTLHNTIVTDSLKGKAPITTADDVGGVNLDAASSYNLIGITSSGGLTSGNNNQLGVASALLKPLQDNGGPTRTHALTYKSPAVDQGDGCVVSGCSLSSPVVDIDQRGKQRTPLNDGDDNGATGVDIGAYERQVTEKRDVPTGDPSTVDVVDAIITFLCVEPCGGSRVNPGSTKSASAIAPSIASPTASLAAIDPAQLNSLQRPNNTVIGAGSSPPLPAFEVTTTASYTQPATVCFYLPAFTDPTFFNGLKVLHREAGGNMTYGDSDDVMVDVTRANNPRDFANKLVCSEVNSFSAFAIAQTVSVGPTAEDATVSGQILDSQGNPIEGAAVRLNGTQNRLTITDAQGKYHFEDVETNGFYVITPSRANFTFSPAQRSFSQLGASTEATFTGATSGGGLNPLDVTEYFVRQQYLDFLGREPDNSGFNFWVNNIESCGNDIGCREVKRIDTSAAFFLSIESRQTGYLIYRFYQAAYGETPNTPVPLGLSEYTSDATQISKGVAVLQNGWQRTLENNTRTFAEDFVKRGRFVAAYPVTMTPVEFVYKMFANGQIPVTDDDYAAAIAEFGGATDTSDVAARARALRRIAENSLLAQRHFNRAFVLMQYFGYLRRDPNSGQDRDFSGFNFWLDKLDRFDGNFREAEMVKAFLSSVEYRARIPR